jgi:selenide,water dikinase
MPKPQAPQLMKGLADTEAQAELARIPMRCGGCGAKVGSKILQRILQRLPDTSHPDVLLKPNQADDAALLQVPAGHILVQSVDYFRAFLDDPYTFGAIAANHALGDLYAMGATPQSALAIATVPYARETVVEQTLYELMAGATDVIQASGAALAGGHTSEGAELAFGLTVNGTVLKQQHLQKGGLQPGDKLILNKPLGTGTLLAADMRGQAKGRWIEQAIQHMLHSNQKAAQIMQHHQAHACTDITGFGLLGHLNEMVQASQHSVQLQLAALPIMDGVIETLAAGIVSSLQPANLRLRHVISNLTDEIANKALYPILFDPQTAGGLLAAIPATQADACLHTLHQQGYPNTCIVGQVTSLQKPQIFIE